MDLQRHIGRELSGLKSALDRSLEGLTQEEISWRPASGCNSIGLILFHMARTEDSIIQSSVKRAPQIWESEKWYQKLNLAIDEQGAHYTIEQVNAFRVPAFRDLSAYYDAVRLKTKECLRGMQPEELDNQITLGEFGKLPAATIFSFIVTHASQHVGEISYLRGVQRGLDK
jgi:uncharacterized damage-inducible protein DinB